jgi:type II secretory pathway component PulJ
MKTIWTVPIRSIRSSQFRSLRQKQIFLRPVVVARPLSQAETASSRETSEMPPRFELKTPKGTKDCESLHDGGDFVYKDLRACAIT